MVRLQHEIAREDFSAAAIQVAGIEVRASGSALLGHLEDLYEDLGAGAAASDERMRKAVRDILRNGRYRPSGRGKPSSEYLLGIWSRQGRIDLINNVVDANNLVSLSHGLPVSAFDVDRVTGDLTIRLGRAGEGYVFNASGQELDCADLVVVCDDRGPIGSPVKDSQTTKLFPGATAIVYVVYANRTVIPDERLLAIATELGELLVEDCPAAAASTPAIFERT